MPVSLSGVMFGVNSVPNGVGIGSPPAYCLPPRTVWQARQSPTSARYSPRPIGELSPFASGAGAPRSAGRRKTAASTTIAAMTRTTSARFIGLPPASRSLDAAALERRLERTRRRGSRVGRDALRPEPCVNRGDVVRRQPRGDLRHAVRALGFAPPDLPAAHLAGDVVAVQADDAGDRRLQSGQCLPVTGRTGGDVLRRIAFGDQRLAAREQRLRRRGSRLRVRRGQGGGVTRPPAGRPGGGGGRPGGHGGDVAAPAADIFVAGGWGT